MAVVRRRGPRRRRSPGSCGCTTTTRTPRTSRRATWPSASRRRRTTARSRSSIAQLARVLEAIDKSGRPRSHARPGHRGPRREPRRARRGDARRLHLRRDAARAMDHGGPRHFGRPRAEDRRAIHRHPADAARLLRPAVARRARRPIAAPGGRWSRDGRRAVLRRVALPAARARMGAALRGGGRRRYKFIDAPHAELYDLEQDASEKTNLIAQQGALADQMRRGLAVGGPEGRPRQPQRRPMPRPPRGSDRSATSAAARPAATESGPLRDPKDGIRFMPRLNRGDVRDPRPAGAGHPGAHVGDCGGSRAC